MIYQLVIFDIIDDILIYQHTYNIKHDMGMHYLVKEIKKIIKTNVEIKVRDLMISIVNEKKCYKGMYDPKLGKIRLTKLHRKERHNFFGIKNLGNSCYANSIMQILFHFFRKVFLKSSVPIIKGLYNKLSINHHDINEILRHFNIDKSQHDPTEFLFQLIDDQLSSTFSWEIKSTLGYVVGRNIILQRQSNIVNDFLLFQDFSSDPINISNFPKSMVIETVDVKLDEYPHIKSNTIRRLDYSISKHTLNNNLQYMMVCLPLFKWKDDKATKINRDTIIPLHAFKFKGIYVQIKAIVFHKGNHMNHGHYLVWIRTGYHTFMELNDDLVQNINIEDRELFLKKSDKNPYILVLERIK